MDPKERKPFASFPLLTGLLLFFALNFPSPSTAGATVAAYMDVQGNVHYVRGKSSRTNRKIAINQRSATRSTKDSNPQKINAFIHAAATEHGVDPLLIKAIIKAESNFDPSAVSPKGAQGLMQLMPATARDLQVADPFDPQDNITGGTKYLRVVCVKFCKLAFRMWWPRSETGGREWVKVSLVGGRRSLGHAANCISCSFLCSCNRFMSR